MNQHRLKCALATMVLIAGTSVAAHAGHVFEAIPMHAHSGIHDGVDGAVTRAYEDGIVVPGARWLRLRFGDWNLGRHSTLTLQSPKDGGTQVFDAESMAVWRGATAVFNGDSLLVTLDVAAGDKGVFVNLDHALAGHHRDDDPDGGGYESLCGDDDRVDSTDNRVGRIWTNASSSQNAAICTAFRVSTGALLTAGHCVDFDPDKEGPLLPDGVLDVPTNNTSWVIEFNIPTSDSDGTTNAASPTDQFLIDDSTVAWNYDGEGQGLGKDWAVFGVLPNSNGDLPHGLYGLPFRLTRELPASLGPVQVTGCGVDTTPGGSNSDNKTLQTSAGFFLGESTGSSSTDLSVSYGVDTTGGSSGSPVISLVDDIVFGIHTTAGCSSTGNSGTSFEVNALEAAINSYTASTFEHVDQGHPDVPTETGSAYRPWDSVAEAVSDVGSGGTVSIVAGSYTQADGNAFTTNKAMTLVAPVGTVTIGG